MKKIIISVAVLATVVCSAVVVTSATKDESAVAKPNYPTESSAYCNLQQKTPTEKEKIKKQITEDIFDEYLKNYNELKANNEDDFRDAEALLIFYAKKQAVEKYDYKVCEILEKYNKIEKGYTVASITENRLAIMATVCEVLNDADICSSLTTEEIATLEYFLQYHYYSLEGEETEDLQNTVRQMLDLPY